MNFAETAGPSGATDGEQGCEPLHRSWQAKCKTTLLTFRYL